MCKSEIYLNHCSLTVTIESSNQREPSSFYFSLQGFLMKQDKINLSPFSKCTCRRELHVSNTKFSYGCGNMTLDFFYKSLGKQKNHRLNRNFNSLLLLLLRFLIFLNSFFTIALSMIRCDLCWRPFHICKEFLRFFLGLVLVYSRISQ